jgi:hypothetical protein
VRLQLAPVGAGDRFEGGLIASQRRTQISLSLGLHAWLSSPWLVPWIQRPSTEPVGLSSAGSA